MISIPGLESNKAKKFFPSKTKNNSQKKTKFCLSIITQFYPPDYAATGQLIQELAFQLEQNEIEIDIFTGQPGYAFKKNNAPKIDKIKKIKIFRSRSSKLLANTLIGKTINGILFTLRAALHIILNYRKYEVLLLTTAPPFLLFIGYLAKIFLGIPYVCLIYDLYPDVITESNLISAQHPIAKIWNFLNLKVWQKSQQIIVLSKTMEARITSKHPHLKSKIQIIHNWANPNWIKPIPKEKNWFAIDYQLDRKFTVLYSGNFGRCHDLKTILGAITKLRNEPIQFVFIGGGTKQEICRQTVTKLDLDNCLFLPYQDKKTLPYSLTSCDLALVSIAPGMEGVVVPSKLYGVMAAGKAIAAICEPHSYLRDLLSLAECGVCFDNNDSESLANFIRYLASDRTITTNMGNAGREYLKNNFTPEIIAQQYISVLQPKSLFVNNK